MVEDHATEIPPDYSQTVMTLHEALEYLNLPEDCSVQLIKKRYLELKKDYLKAIYNAPSDHFSTLYRENLDKIEEAYNLLKNEDRGIDDFDDRIRKNLHEINQKIESFVDTGRGLNSEMKQRIKECIQQINALQYQLFSELPGRQTDSIAKPSARWEVKPKSGIGKSKAQPRPHPSGPPPNANNALMENWVINYLLQTSFIKSARARSTLYAQMLWVAILLIMILAVIGFIYLMYPWLMAAGFTLDPGKIVLNHTLPSIPAP